MQAVPGAHFGDYMLSYRLGVGGMAEVWAAEHSALGVKVALKLLFNASPTLYERLLREGRAQARLEHPNILPVLNVVHVHGVSALVLPLIEGPSLEQLLSGHRPSPAEAAALLRAIVAGVAHAHHHGMIHRDLKPGNVLLEVRGGQVVPQVADFGIVKTDDDPRYTREGAMMGTLNYAAPEQLLDAGAVNHRADLFSLGVMLVELLSGKLPFVAASLGKLLNAHDHPPDLSGVPPAWRPLCQQLLQIEPDDRMADCAGLLVGLAALSPPDDRILAYDGALATAIREMMQRSDAPGFGRGLTEPPPRRPSITTPPPNNLPAEMDDFFGRAHDITALESTIAAGARLVSVLSAGGMGKTRLAIRFGHTALAQFPGGVWFCDLSEARQHDAMAYAVARALDVPLANRDPIAQLGHAIASRGRCMIILDNFEQLVAVAQKTVGQWRQRAPQATFLVTSRQLLDLPGEQIFSLDPLDRDAAVALFISRTRARRRGFSPCDDEMTAIGELVGLLDRLPLAIELAAARARMLSPRAICDRMANRFALLKARNLPPRQATLRGAIDWSWELLDEAEQLAFAQLSVFEGGFTMAAAEAVLDFTALDEPPWLLDLLQSLLDKSMIRVLPANAMGQPRFGMLLSLQAYGREQMTDPDAVQRRHIDWFSALGDRASIRRLTTADAEDAWLSTITELDNIIAAAQRAIRLGMATAACQAAILAALITEQRGPPRFAMPLLTAAAELLVSPDDDRVRGRTRLYQGLLQLRSGENQAARDVLIESRALARTTGDPVLEIWSEIWLGDIAHTLSDQEDLKTHYLRALDLAVRHDEPRAIAAAKSSLGVIALEDSQRADAAQLFEESLILAREIGDRRQETLCLGNLGTQHRLNGQLDRAQSLLQEAIDLSRTMGDLRQEGIWEGNLSATLHLSGQFEAAQAHYNRCLKLIRRIGDRRRESMILGDFADLEAAMGRAENAWALRQQALTIAQEIGDRQRESIWLGNFGHASLQRGEMENAKTYLTRALEIAQQLRNEYLSMIWRGNLGAVSLVKGDLDDAMAHNRHALREAIHLKDKRLEGVWLAQRGEILAAQGHTEDARRSFTEGDRCLEAVLDPLQHALLLCRWALMEAQTHQRAAAAALLTRAQAMATAEMAAPGSELTQAIGAVNTILSTTAG